LQPSGPAGERFDLRGRVPAWMHPGNACFGTRPALSVDTVLQSITVLLPLLNCLSVLVHWLPSGESDSSRLRAASPATTSPPPCPSPTAPRPAPPFLLPALCFSASRKTGRSMILRVHGFLRSRAGCGFAAIPGFASCHQIPARWTAWPVPVAAPGKCRVSPP
jgi:hypothetical protein